MVSDISNQFRNTAASVTRVAFVILACVGTGLTVLSIADGAPLATTLEDLTIAVGGGALALLFRSRRVGDPPKVGPTQTLSPRP